MRSGKAPSPAAARTGVLRVSALALAAALLVAPQARAGDGAVAIHHACATATGCFAGDAPGYPVTIDGSAGLHYVLTSSLILPNPDTTGIRVATSDVSIDLGGFKIIRADCVGATTSCRFPGTGRGIEVASQLYLGLRVRDGDIVGMGRGGIFAGGQAKISNVRVSQAAGNGIQAGGASVVTDCRSFSNLGDGIQVGPASVVSGNAVVSNGSTGISTFNGSLVLENLIRNNSSGLLNNSVGTPFFDTGYRGNIITNNGNPPQVRQGVDLGANLCLGPGDTNPICP